MTTTETLTTEISLSLAMDKFTIVANAAKNIDHANAKIAKLAATVIAKLAAGDNKAAMNAHHGLNIAVIDFSWGRI